MNLDDKALLDTLDTQDMLGHIDGLPEQFAKAWQTGLEMPIIEGWRNLSRVLICGMGGSAIGGDLLAGLLENEAPVAVSVNRAYGLPAWAREDETLVVLSSFSGNTEETLAAYQEASTRGLSILALTTGGKLAELAGQNPRAVVWQFEHVSQPRAALGWSLGLLLALADKMDWVQNLGLAVSESVSALQAHRAEYGFEVPAAQNAAKRQAGQFVERFPVIYGAGVFEIVARRWKTQLNENSKIWATYEPMPESNHNNIVGIEHPSFLIPKTIAVFLRSASYDHPRVALRYDLTAKVFMENAIGVDSFFAQGESLLAQVMHAIQYGDYVSFYAALANGVDPTSIVPIDRLKHEMAQYA